MTLVFNHIPKTGGTTLRIILNKVYGVDRVFFINSRNIGSSISAFRNLPDHKKSEYRVIAGHGANLLSPMVDDPFRVTILREPVELFISQYHYLRSSPNSIYRETVAGLPDFDAYLEFAREHGQDNLLTRFSADEIGWLVKPGSEPLDLSKQGAPQIDKAWKQLSNYDCILDLAAFNAGVFALSKKLSWSTIPFFKKANKTANKSKLTINASLDEKLRKMLKWDIILYQRFQQAQLDCGRQVDKSGFKYALFSARQRLIGKIWG